MSRCHRCKAFAPARGSFRCKRCDLPHIEQYMQNGVIRWTFTPTNFSTTARP